MDLNTVRRTNLRFIIDSFMSKGGSKSDFAAKAGLGQAHMSHMISEPPHRGIGDSVARKIEGALGIPVQWLDTAHSKKSLISNQNNDEFNFNNFIMELVKQKAPTKSTAFTLVELGNDLLPAKVRMKTGPEALQQMVFDETLAKGTFGGRAAKDLRLYTVCGDAMLPTIKPGDTVILDITCHPGEIPHDGIYLFTYGDQLHLKRLQVLGNNISVLSSNTEYKEWTFPKDEKERECKLTVIGLLIGKVGIDLFA